MKIGLYLSYEEINDEIFFGDQDIKIGDNLLGPIKMLKNTLLTNGYDVTIINTPEKASISDLILVFDHPFQKTHTAEAVLKHQNRYLVVAEPPLIRPDNHNLKILRQYNKIFTWSDVVVAACDNAHKINFSISWDKTAFSDDPRMKRIVAIYSNKKKNNSLYKLRHDYIRKLARADMLDLYGMGWDKRAFSRGARYFNRYPTASNLFYTTPKCWLGEIKRKGPILRNYDFSLIIENEDNTDGYITEKMLDALNARTIPIYKGCRNIRNIIPNDCYLMLDDFRSPKALLDYLKNLDVYRYRANIEKYIHSVKSQNFSSERYVSVISNEIDNHATIA